ncbi:MAG: PTS sugar transporter subunit IIB [Lactobacillus iners]|uniref:PTS system mannose/fructose/N-acetylgalactosamine-transporter subunit IIB n=1 Tax=Lactobacillus iners TaxID=147802 RepID=UPI0001E5D549|nr:PTS sugar transporter subunit IIB [Lactobacillus iners]EFO66673.1 PTS system sorbose subfamily IIB component [Lactobacillus iners LactinV 11V1-d]MCT7676783.1 PTS sugar transporter subunit IIB [Lactobacillus iners]MCT7728911.1 PTS sugar transporter subunit IIB [Lactobacillus iners]MCT7734835.1 PTS sugar transporter subunit IIB [Lactobacillus iners]MCT7810491.1 PTS sugar transporter subunit IIB [Lactobacillus iners]
MNIVGVRIDGRLVHGQVANLWTPKLQADRIIVLDEQIINDNIQKSGLRMATPRTTHLSVLDYKTAADHLLNDRYGTQRLLLVAKRPKEFLDLIDMGVKIDSINVGTMSQTNTTQMITKQINVEQEDIKVFDELNAKGVHLFAQLNPSVEAHDFMKLLNDKINR